MASASSPASPSSSNATPAITASSKAGVPANLVMHGFSWQLLATHLPDGEVLDEWCQSMDEQFIMKADLQIYTDETSKMKNRTVTLTEESWIETKLLEENRTDPPSLCPAGSPAIVVPALEKKHMALTEIHSIDLDLSKEGQGRVFRINFFSGSASSKAKAGLSKLKRFLAVGTNFDDFLKEKMIRCHSAEEASQWILVLDKLLRNVWQRKLEATLLPAPEIYKRHAFVIKQTNDRLLMLSDLWFYNVEVTYKPTELKSIKWAIPVSSFTGVNQLNHDPELAVMSISFDAVEAKKQWDTHHRSNKSKELVDKKHQFQFRTRSEREKFVNSLAAAYWQVTRKKLPLATLDTKEK